MISSSKHFQATEAVWQAAIGECLLPSMCSSDTQGPGLDPNIINSVLSISYDFDKIIFKLVQRNHSPNLEIHQPFW